MKLIAEWLALLRREFSAYNFLTLQKDLLAGLTVAAVALPLALAFGVASGADAAAGLVRNLPGWRGAVLEACPARQCPA